MVLSGCLRVRESRKPNFEEKSIGRLKRGSSKERDV
jgi:hypothetical protein